jgi:hypothetical protein
MLKAALNIHRRITIEITPDQVDPLGVCCLMEDDNFEIYINDKVHPEMANWIVLHELKHCQQEEHEQVQSSGKYAQSMIDAGLDPALVMSVHRDPLTPEQTERYRATPYEREADEFANRNRDVYRVVFG